jgi:hypothetical protein
MRSEREDQIDGAAELEGAGGHRDESVTPV